MAIGVAIIFPMLMLVIVALQVMAETSRVEQSLQATANQAARIASLCCYGTEQAAETVEAGLASAESANAFNRVICDNDFIADSDILFTDATGTEVAVEADGVVPPGGMVRVVLRCRVPLHQLGGVSIPGLDIERRAIGAATIDPYRFRPAT